MKVFEHRCIDGKTWYFQTLEPLLPKEIPAKCPNKEDCGQGWNDVSEKFAVQAEELLKQVIPVSSVNARIRGER